MFMACCACRPWLCLRRCCSGKRKPLKSHGLLNLFCRLPCFSSGKVQTRRCCCCCCCCCCSCICICSSFAVAYAQRKLSARNKPPFQSLSILEGWLHCLLLLGCCCCHCRCRCRELPAGCCGLPAAPAAAACCCCWRCSSSSAGCPFCCHETRGHPTVRRSSRCLCCFIAAAATTTTTAAAANRNSLAEARKS